MLAEPAPLGRRGDYASDVATVRVVLVDSDGDGLSHVGSLIERTGAPAVEDLYEIFNGPLRLTMPKARVRQKRSRSRCAAHRDTLPRNRS